MQFYPMKKFTSVLVVMMLVILLSSNETASSFLAGLLVSLHDIPDFTR
jgi:cytochrome P450